MTTIAHHVAPSTHRGNPVRISFRVTVPLAHGTPAETALDATIAAWVFAPYNVPGEGAASMWYLAIPGATYRGLSYFDRQVEGYAAEEFSIARFLARHGIGLVVIDTLGTGESEGEVDGGLITRFVTAGANAQVLHHLRERLLAGMLVPGLAPVPEDTLFLGAFGHSMGAFQLAQLAALLEDRGTPLDAAIFAGWSHGPVDYARLRLDADAISTGMVGENGYLTIPFAAMRTIFYGPSPTVPEALIEADERDAVVIPKGLLDEVLIPGIVAREAGSIRCPVLHVLAAHDLGTSAQSEGQTYASTRLFTAYTQPQAAHCNFESSRRAFWQVLADWSRMVAVSGHPFRRADPLGREHNSSHRPREAHGNGRKD